MRHEICLYKNSAHEPDRLRDQGSHDLMANALTSIVGARRLFIRNGLPLNRPPLFLARAAIVKKVEPVARQDEHGHDGNE